MSYEKTNTDMGYPNSSFAALVYKKKLEFAFCRTDEPEHPSKAELSNFSRGSKSIRLTYILCPESVCIILEGDSSRTFKKYIYNRI